MDEDKDKLTNTAFEAVVGVRSGYSRGLGAGIKPLKGKNIAGLHEELKKEREKRQDIEKKLKDVETQRQQDIKMMEEMTSKIEESQRQLGEKVDKQVEAKVATMLRQMLNIPVSI
jgi:septal ring factor EnvC (AmiA/AmiB activator)